MKIAILGGTFDPIHIGHLIAASTVADECAYDKIIFIPTSIPPHKNISNKVSDKNRLDMVKLSIEHDERFSVCNYEILSGGLSYTINTLNYLYETCKNIDGKVGLIIGYDLLKGFHKWKEAKKISEISNILLVDRNSNKDIDETDIEIMKEFDMKVVNNPNVDISSTKIRENIEKNKSVKYFLRENVCEYIISNGLYK